MLAEVAGPRLRALGLELLVQDQPGARTLLAGRMRQEVGTVLFGLQSFWEGVDFPGRQVQCVVIESLPFAPAGDPVVEARTAALNEEGRDGFTEYYLAQAALRFAQGCGRLLRTEQDSGLVVVLDKRLAFKDYGSRFLMAAPPFGQFRVVGLEDAVDLLREKAGLPVEPRPAPPANLLEQLTLPGPVVPAGQYEEIRPRVRLALERLLGYGEFRPHQEEIIRATLAGQPVLAVMQTGAGKSVCYQLPALLRDGLTLVITPVIALMKDQVDRLRARGITVVDYLSATQESARRGEVLNRLIRRELRLLYVTPERLALREFRALLKGGRLKQVVIDEAHCVSQWGHHFRPDYLEIGRWLKELGDVPVAAFTATATPAVLKDIRKYLHLKGAVEVNDLQDRPNLHFQVIRIQAAESQRIGAKLLVLSELVKSGPTPAIVYTSTVRMAEIVAEQLNMAGIVAGCYTGSLGQEERTAAQEAFMDGTVGVMVATNAFGMGVDKPDVRQVIHFDIPLGVEAYYQEAGRAGRDGLPATCTLIYHPGDMATLRFLADVNTIKEEDVRQLAAFLYSHKVHYATDEELARQLGDGGRYEISKYRVLRYHFRQLGWLTEERLPSQVVIQVSPGTAKTGVPAGSAEKRLTAEFLTGPAQQNLIELAGRYNLPLARVVEILEREAASGQLRFHTATSTIAMEYTGPPGPTAVKQFPFRHLDQLRARTMEGVESIKGYAESNKCRIRILHGFFGHTTGDCGRCDNCRPAAKPKVSISVLPSQSWAPDPVRVVLELVSAYGGRYMASHYKAALAGITQYKVPDALVRHPLFGRLAHLGYQGVGQLLDRLEKDGLVAPDLKGRVRLSATGRQRLLGD